MSTINKPYTFSPNTTASSSQVNANFDTLYNDYNGGIAAANLAANSVSTAKIADSAVTTDKINDASVTNAKLAANTAWVDWTPTLVGMTGGTLNYSKYSQIGKTVNIRFKYTFAGAGLSSSPPTFTLPVTAANYSSDTVMTSTGITTNSGLSTLHPAFLYFNSTTVVRIVILQVVGSYTEFRNISSTIPHTYASGSVIEVTGCYEAA